MQDAEFDLRSILGLLRRQFRLIVISVLVVVAIAGAYAFSLTPIYSATALVLVDPSKKNLLDPEAATGSSAADSARIDSEVEIMRSDHILLTVIRDRNLVADSEFGVSLSTRDRLLSMLRLGDATLPTGEAALNQTLGKLRSALGVQRRGLTYLISVQARSETPAHAADLANAVAQAYINDQLASKVNSTLASRDVLQARINAARQSLLESEGSFDGFISSNINDIVSSSGRTDLASMQAQIEALNRARRESAATADVVQASLAAGNFQSVVDALQSDAVAELERQREAVNMRLDSAVTGSATQIDLQAELAAIEQRLRDQAITEVGTLQAEVEASQAREAGMRETIRGAVLGSNLSASILTQLYELQQNAELARSQYQTLLARSQDLEAQADLQLADSRIVSPALAPAAPSFPNTTLILAAALLAALTIGVALAFLYENFVGGFTSEGQVESVLRTPVTAVPRERSKGYQDGELSSLMVSAPLSAFAESVRRIRANLDQMLHQTPPPTEDGKPSGHVVMVTSTMPNEGKSTLALSLARSYALAGKSTLLIDCDLRKPSIHKQLGSEPSSGLLDYLTDAVDVTPALNNIVVKDELTTTTVILGARRSNIPTDQLVGGQSFTKLIRAARQVFDVIILDTSPIGPVVDGVYIARSADAIVFLVRWGTTAQTDARKSIATLTAAKAPHAGILTVLNQQDGSRRRYGREYGEYYTEPA